jgi:sec-independent protein translocase protein TatA
VRVWIKQFVKMLPFVLEKNIMGIGIWELVLLLLIVLLLFGTKRLRNVGGDLGTAIKSFRTALNASEEPAPKPKPESDELAGKDDKPDRDV